MKNITLLMFMTLVLSIGMASAISLKIANSTGTVMIDLSDTGNLSAAGNISAGLYFVGSGKYLTDIAVATDSVTIAGENITSGTIDFARLPTLTDRITLSGENITAGTIDFARLPSLTDKITLAYQNITGTPTCSAGEYITMNATGWICETPSASAMDYTNLAMTNVTNTFAQDQIFNKGINVTTSVNLLSAIASISRGGSNITIDNSNNVIITLG